ncbi:MAG: hypothetical protein SFU25_05695 [Candidatus Caenarcaniphilales bacterium]|nr:hypothetical protein [Candidatus Caenarcaniphilales bacterium]
MPKVTNNQPHSSRLHSAVSSRTGTLSTKVATAQKPTLKLSEIDTEFKSYIDKSSLHDAFLLALTTMDSDEQRGIQLFKQITVLEPKNGINQLIRTAFSPLLGLPEDKARKILEIVFSNKQELQEQMIAYKIELFHKSIEKESFTAISAKLLDEIASSEPIKAREAFEKFIQASLKFYNQDGKERISRDVFLKQLVSTFDKALSRENQAQKLLTILGYSQDLAAEARAEKIEEENWVDSKLKLMRGEFLGTQDWLRIIKK